MVSAETVIGVQGQLGGRASKERGQIFKTETRVAVKSTEGGGANQWSISRDNVTVL